MTERAARALSEMQFQGKLDDRLRARLSAALREAVEQARAAGGPEFTLTDPAALLAAYRPPADPLEQVDRLLVYLSRRDPDGGAYVPVNMLQPWDFTVTGAETPEAGRYALGHAMTLGYIEQLRLDELTFRLTPAGWGHLREIRAGGHSINTAAAADTVIGRVFLSHAAADRPLAEYVAAELHRLRPELDVFVASRPGQIPPGDEWLQVIYDGLRAADAYCVLLTPRSIERPWVWFETGAAWMSKKVLLPVCAAGLTAREVPLPLGSRQVYTLEVADEAREVFRRLGAEHDAPITFAEQMARLGRPASS